MSDAYIVCRIALVEADCVPMALCRAVILTYYEINY